MILIATVQTDILCILLMLLSLVTLARQKVAVKIRQTLMMAMCICTILLSLADIGAWLLPGTSLPGVRRAVHGCNIAYILLPTIIALLWMAFVNHKLYGRIFRDRRNAAIVLLPAAVSSLLLLSNPWTELFFSLDSACTYARGPLLWIQWAVAWLYLCHSIAQILLAINAEKSALRRRELFPYLIFALGPAFGGVLQMSFYGTAGVQAGLVFSMELILQHTQAARISSDELTGLNNRRELDSYLEARLRAQDAPIWLMMMDVDSFKQINDHFGHAAGDRALVETASALKAACGRAPGRLFLARYGGDEFVIVGHREEDELPILRTFIAEELQRRRTPDAPYRLRLSMGTAAGTGRDFHSSEELLTKADREMYLDKARHREAQ